MELAPVLLLAVFAGITELITRARAKDWWVVVTILTCALVGAAFGAANYFPGIDVVQGAVYGFGASGVLKGLSMITQKSTPAPSDAVVK